VTAEVAVALPVLVLLVAAGMAAVGVVTAQLRCVDSARTVARAVARGEPVAVAQRLGVAAAPAGAAITISRQGDRIVVTVSAATHPVTRLAPAIAVSARAVGELEPGADDSTVG
jgi:Flp pilus assembly protein TadG